MMSISSFMQSMLWLSLRLCITTRIKSWMYSFLSQLALQVYCSKTGISFLSYSAVSLFINNFNNLPIIITMQANLNPSVEDYLSVIKNFLLETHQRISQEYETPAIDSSLLSVIDQASIKLKTNKEHINILEKQLKQAELQKIAMNQIKTDHSHLQKRVNQKCDEISILRETVKTLYTDNQRLNMEKEGLSKQLNSAKQNYNSLKKKLKRQEEQISNHRSELKKLTQSAEERLNQYLKDNEHNQQTIKKLNYEIDKFKAEIQKKDKSINSINKKLEQCKNYQSDYENSVSIIETLKYENNLLKNQIQNLKERSFQQKTKLIQENQALLKDLEQANQKSDKFSLINKDLQLNLQSQTQKSKNYEHQIIMRTQKLKEKTKQIKIYNEQMNKLGKRVQELSALSDEVIQENRQLSQKCKCLQERLQELRSFQAYVGKIKGDMSYKKSQELGKLFDSLGKLQTHA